MCWAAPTGDKHIKYAPVFLYVETKWKQKFATVIIDYSSYWFIERSIVDLGCLVSFSIGSNWFLSITLGYLTTWRFLLRLAESYFPKKTNSADTEIFACLTFWKLCQKESTAHTVFLLSGRLLGLGAWALILLKALLLFNILVHWLVRSVGSSAFSTFQLCNSDQFWQCTYWVM